MKANYSKEASGEILQYISDGKYCSHVSNKQQEMGSRAIEATMLLANIHTNSSKLELNPWDFPAY